MLLAILPFVLGLGFLTIASFKYEPCGSFIFSNTFARNCAEDPFYWKIVAGALLVAMILWTIKLSKGIKAGDAGSVPILGVIMALYVCALAGFSFPHADNHRDLGLCDEKPAEVQVQQE